MKNRMSWRDVGVVLAILGIIVGTVRISTNMSKGMQYTFDAIDEVIEWETLVSMDGVTVSRLTDYEEGTLCYLIVFMRSDQSLWQCRTLDGNEFTEQQP